MKPFRTQAVCVPRPEAEGPKASSSEVLEPRFYRAPELHQIGTLEKMQGRNYNSNKDLGNDNYYI